MFEVRFHGRGGQGAVTAANLLAIAAFKEGRYIQSFPIFGTERRGAPVAAFVRMDDKPISIRCQIYEPNAVVVLDSGVMEAVNVTKGLKKNGIIVINTRKKPKELGLKEARVATVNATSIAVKHRLGSETAPIVNTAILGAYARATEKFEVEKIGISSILSAIRENAPAKPDENVAAAKEAYSSALF